MLTLFQLPSTVLIACYRLTHHLISYFVLLTSYFNYLLHFFTAYTKSQVYIKALMPYRIDKVFILVVRFNKSSLPSLLLHLFAFCSATLSLLIINIYTGYKGPSIHGWYIIIKCYFNQKASSAA
jgi:hypothetical protein